MKCSYCDGHGSVHECADEYDCTQDDCEQCDGSGYIDCSYCDGSGIIIDLKET